MFIDFDVECYAYKEAVVYSKEQNVLFGHLFIFSIEYD